MTKPSFPVPPPGSAVVITGSSTGIGRHAAAGLAAAGFLVFAGVRRVRDVETLVEAYPGRVFPLLLDVTDHDAGVMRAAEEVRETLEDMGGKVKLAGLVNNAGIGLAMPLELLPLSRLRQVMEINVVGLLGVTQAFLPQLRRDQGRIINVGSAAGFTVPVTYGAYSSSKYALEAISDAFRLELRPWRISVSLLEPGTIESEIRRKNVGDAAPFKNLTESQYVLYQQIFDTYEQRVDTLERAAGSPQLTTDAILHALTSSTPQSRYVLGAYQGLSLWLLRHVVLPFVPDHLLDWGKMKMIDLAARQEMKK
ncbi:hypothetical protein NSK_008077 [Nannochloropsis salina CCMP1776]|uniref:Ketoreductase domain-containing protein n=1 Tax=Nannochloropsis salina CCMP1776 TaxID=1027361 RepID=A0A4D9CNB2_9STRA|nr:hypothetical protein NSK_008077 [Nannochloropsis salina CCMP1776]|eukprot:TFJ80651.1 hypothetical protein NSK_008077 [Nannochloropsis salina CCMP1776]